MKNLKHDHTSYDPDWLSKDQENKKGELVQKEKVSEYSDITKKNTSTIKSVPEVKPKYARKPIRSKKSITIVGSDGKEIKRIPKTKTQSEDKTVRSTTSKVSGKPVKKPVENKKEITRIESKDQIIKKTSSVNNEENKIRESSNQFVGYKSKKTVSGIAAILLGFFGMHKFILGYTKQGLVMLLVTLLTFGMAAPIVSLIGFIEGIIYLTKSDDEFYRIYQAGKRPWF